MFSSRCKKLNYLLLLLFIRSRRISLQTLQKANEHMIVLDNVTILAIKVVMLEKQWRSPHGTGFFVAEASK